jgi:class 3 adenylate cyclase
MLTFDLTLVRYLTELLGRNLTFPDIEMIGRYFFKEYSTHRIEKTSDSITISPLSASRVLVTECEKHNKLADLLAFVIELDGTLLNGKTVTFDQLENLLYRLSTQGMYYDFNRRRLVSYDRDKTVLKNWGALKDGKEYPIIIASLDVCDNSTLVQKYRPRIMEKVYYALWEYVQNKLRLYNGRVWTWAGDGGIVAFRYEDGPESAVACCLEVLFSLPVFNVLPSKPIEDQLCLRFGLDAGPVKFFNDTGRIVSDVINFAAHLEKMGTEPDGLSVTEILYQNLTRGMQEMFTRQAEFEGRPVYSLTYRCMNGLL